MGKSGCLRQTVLILFLMTTVQLTNGNNYNPSVDQPRNEIQGDQPQIQQRIDKSLIPAIVAELYGGNPDNTQRTLYYIQMLPSLSEIGIGYKSLYDTIKINNQLNSPQTKLLADDLKAKLESNAYKTAPEDLKKVFKTLIAFFPPDLVCLKNKYYDEYMFAGTGQSGRNSKTRQILSERRYGEVNTDAKWILEPANGNNVYRIKNKNCNEYLMVEENNNLCGRRRRVSTWRADGGLTTGDTWEIQPVSGNQLSKIRNIAFNEYLYPSDDGHKYDANTRIMYTWRHQTEPVPIGNVWQITKC